MSEHIFGGRWTEEKLSRLSHYLTLYSRALSNQNFNRLYLDAFAGTGYRSADKTNSSQLSFLNDPNVQNLQKGSAVRALQINPEFHQYFFIEADQGRYAALKKLNEKFPRKAHKMHFINEDANTALRNICNTTNWRKNRAVVFLDPYGTQVNWGTLEAIGETRSIDLWYLFPVGAVQRMMANAGGMPASWVKRINNALGSTEWEEQFYQQSETTDLFGQQIVTKQKTANLNNIEAFVRKRLSEVFKGGVCRHPLRLSNSKVCMFILFFACGNPSPKAKSLAMRLADYVLKA